MLSKTVNLTLLGWVFFFLRRWQETPSDLFSGTRGSFQARWKATVVVTTRYPANMRGQVFYGNKTNILLLWKLENGRKVTDLPDTARYLISPARAPLCNYKDAGRLRDEALEKRERRTARGTALTYSPLQGRRAKPVLGRNITTSCACTRRSVPWQRTSR